MPGTERRRAVLEAIISDPKSSPETLLRACELAQRLGEDRAEDHPLFYEWLRFHEMSNEDLRSEVDALSAPVTTLLAFEEDDGFAAEVERRAQLRASEMTAALRRERHQLQKALKQAEARAAAPTPAKASKPASEAPSDPDGLQQDAGAVVADLHAARERRWSDAPPSGRLLR